MSSCGTFTTTSIYVYIYITITVYLHVRGSRYSIHRCMCWRLVCHCTFSNGVNHVAIMCANLKKKKNRTCCERTYIKTHNMLHVGYKKKKTTTACKSFKIYCYNYYYYCCYNYNYCYYYCYYNSYYNYNYYMLENLKICDCKMWNEKKMLTYKMMQWK